MYFYNFLFNVKSFRNFNTLTYYSPIVELISLTTKGFFLITYLITNSIFPVFFRIHIRVWKALMFSMYIWTDK